MDIKQTERGNRFYIHGLNIKKKPVLKPGYGDPKVSTFNSLKQVSNNTTITQKESDVNKYYEKISKNDTRFSLKAMLWGAKTGTHGLNIGDVVEELQDRGVNSLKLTRIEKQALYSYSGY